MVAVTTAVGSVFGFLTSALGIVTADTTLTVLVIGIPLAFVSISLLKHVIR